MDFIRKEREQLLKDSDVHHTVQSDEVKVSISISDVQTLYTSFFEFLLSVNQKQKFVYDSVSKNELNQVQPSSKRVKTFESLSAPAKNLIFAIGDVQLQKHAMEEQLFAHLSSDLQCIAQRAVKVQLKSNEALEQLKKECSENTLRMLDSLSSEMYSGREYLQAVEKLKTMEAFFDVSLNPHASFTERARTVRHLLDQKIIHTEVSLLSNEDNKNNATNDIQLQSIDERLKLRMRKNEIAKQKMIELSKMSKPSNLTNAIEKLRMAEVEIDDSIAALNASMNQHTAPSMTMKKAYDSSSSVDNLDEVKKTVNDLCVLGRQFDVKLRVLQDTIQSVSNEDIGKYANDLSASFQNACVSFQREIQDKIDLTVQAHKASLNRLLKSENMLRIELTNLAQIIKSDARGIETCLKSILDASQQRSDSRIRACFFENVHFLETSFTF